MRDELHIALVTPEAAPFAKSGELAEFCSSLPRYLIRLGFRVSLIMPKYGTPQIASLHAAPVFQEIAVPLNGERARASVFRAEQKGYEIYLVDSPKYFLRENVYGPPSGNYLDNDERFVFFSRAVLEFLLRAGLSPDVLHCQNWPTSLIPVFLQSHYRESPAFRSTATLLTLHNTAYQGEFPAETLALMDLNWDFFGPRRLSLNGKFNFLQAGAASADLVNTVSRAYEKELLSRRTSSRLSDVLRKKRKSFTSVRNGLDRESWDPEKDPYIAAPFGPGRTQGKARCKQDLIAAARLAVSADSPLLAFVSHLSPVKGADILAQSLEEFVGLGAGVVLFGEGEERYQKDFAAAARRFPGKVAFQFEPGPVLLHKIIAGADVLLLPSLVEPSGLNLFAGFRYGTVPVVRATGGLREAVRPYSSRTGAGNGFAFGEYTGEALVRAVRQAVDCRASRPARWQRIMEEGMRQEFSWEDTARGYAGLYEKALKIKRGG